MTMTLFLKDSFPQIVKELCPEDIKNLSSTNHEMRLFFTDPSTAVQIWQPLVPSFPESMMVCQTRADIIQRGPDYFARTIDFLSLNERCVAKLTYSKIDPNSLVWSTVSGQIDAIYIKENDPIIATTNLFLICAMKMEMRIRAGIAGTIKKVFVTERMEIEPGHLMALIRS
ncbi:MAG: acetyl-CoA carboxylase biotin carboxyl carrier protein subunit [Alphaproteobacteria bacterium]|nr:acetyl-CoA carboxylase biotin carboxyl carrier protein subunit [Alphaproteobacteria bacterium]MBP9877435.1 acetyl-CoA carboxylase biotin carboxyl carrier protein subunit [Alphaproteobacteria bacterium]